MTAIIAAATALVASSLTSWLTFRGVRHQAKAQREVAAQDHALRQAAESRAAQKSACIQFIESAIRSAALVQEIRRSDLADDEYQARLNTAHEALSDLIRAQAVLSVEGPTNVAGAATEARWSLDREFAAARAERAGLVDAEAVNVAGDARRRAVGRVGQAARRGSGHNDGPPMAAPCIGGTA